jgi:hypothetical protein
MEKQNRAERRKSKFGGGRATEHGGWPTSGPNPVFGVETPGEAAAAREAAPAGKTRAHTPAREGASEEPPASGTPAPDEASKRAEPGPG